MFRLTTIFFASALVGLLPHAAAAQQPGAGGSTHLDPVLAAEARITLDSARKIALHRVPHGAIASEELERENGRLIYSFDMSVPGKRNIREVNVNAITGAVVGVHEESPATEKKEAHAESAKKRTP